MKNLAAIVAIGLLALYAEPTTAKDWQHITIATEGAFAPWNLTTANGELEGFDVDLSRDLCARMNIECTLVAQNWDGLIPGLQVGKYDVIMAAMSATPEREKVISFTQPYGSTGQTFAVLKDGPLADLPLQGEVFNLTNSPESANEAIETLRPWLKGKTIGVQGAAVAAKFLSEEFGDDVTIREYQTTEQHDLDLLAGRVDAVMAGPPYLMNATKDPANANMKMAGPRFLGGVLGLGSSIGIRKEDNDLREMFNRALSEAKSDGTTKRLSEKWFGFDVTVY